VTRLGEFSPVGYLFSLDSLLKMTEVFQILRFLLHGKSVVLCNFDKKMFFTNSSGHPAATALVDGLREKFLNGLYVEPTGKIRA
jgi:hypothetical protein